MLGIKYRQGPYAYIEASGRLSRKDFAALEPQLLSMVESNPTVRLLIHLVGFQGWRLSGLAEEIRLSRRYSGHIDRIAVVGKGKSQALAIRFIKPFMSSDIRFFPENREGDALAWLGLTDLVDEAGRESFPASDPPSFTLGR